MEVKSRQSRTADEIDGNGTIYEGGVNEKQLGRRDECHSHHEDRDGGFTIKEYIVDKGTENAYDSGR